jgi:translation elongation factor EF-1alpha
MVVHSSCLVADQLEPPTRDVTSSLRLPISNVFKGQNSSIAVSGRVCGGVVQVGERVRVLPGDETAIIKSASEMVGIAQFFDTDAQTQ